MQPLDEQTRDRILSGETIASFSQIVEELVLNAIDAHCKTINVLIDFAQLNVTVQDDGTFISDNLAICNDWCVVVSRCGDS